MVDVLRPSQPRISDSTPAGRATRRTPAPAVSAPAPYARGPSLPPACSRMQRSSSSGPAIPTDLMISIIVSASIKSGSTASRLVIAVRIARPRHSGPASRDDLGVEAHFLSELGEPLNLVGVDMRVVDDHCRWPQFTKIVRNLLPIIGNLEQREPPEHQLPQQERLARSRRADHEAVSATRSAQHHEKRASIDTHWH